MNEFKQKLREAEKGADESEALWQEYRRKIEVSIKQRSTVVDMGMDLAE